VDAKTEEFKRGWRILVAASLGVAFGASPLPFHAIGPLTVPLSEEFGWGRGDVQFALFLFKVAVVVLVPIIGGFADTLGVRKVAIAALAAFGLLFASLAFTPDSLPVFYLIWVLAGALGSFSTPVSWSRGVNGWFVQGRGLALAIMLTGTGLTAAVLPSFTTYFIQSYGWRVTFFALGMLPLLVAMPFVVAWFREAHEKRGQPASAAARPIVQGATMAMALRDYRFWVLGISSVLIAVGMGGTISNFVPLLVDRDFDRQSAATIAGAIGITIVVGRLGTGYLIDRFWAPGVTLPLLVMPALACLILASQNVPSSYALAAAIMIGLATGAEMDLVAYLTARYFGLAHYGKIYGVQYSLFALVSGISPFLFGKVYDRFGNYEPMLYAAAAGFIVGGGLLLTMGRYPTFRPAVPQPA
jgi:MFS family permease